MFLAKGSNRFCEIDSYSGGRLPNTGYSISWDIEFESHSLKKIIEQIKEYHSINDDNINIEGDILNVTTLEKSINGHWADVNSEDVKRWKNDDLELYFVSYDYKLFKSI